MGDRKQRGLQRFFGQFVIIYSSFCSIPFAFQHCPEAVFPCVPRLSVAGYVVKPFSAQLFTAGKSTGFSCGELHHCLQRGQQTLFRQFWMDYSRFCSTPFAFRHSLKPVFPCTPNLSVAGYVVRNHCGIWTLGSGPARSQSKKVGKVNSVCLKRLQSNRNLRRWIAPLSTMRSDFDRKYCMIYQICSVGNSCEKVILRCGLLPRVSIFKLSYPNTFTKLEILVLFACLS